MKRLVYIELKNGSWRVLYLDRPKRGRYQAAVFYAKDWSREQVIEYVKNNHRLELV